MAAATTSKSSSGKATVIKDLNALYKIYWKVHPNLVRVFVFIIMIIQNVFAFQDIICLVLIARLKIAIIVPYNNVTIKDYVL